MRDAGDDEGLASHVARVLRWVWDPIGLGPEGPADEYDAYVPDLVALTRGTAVFEDALIAHLIRIEIEMMHLSLPPAKRIRAARALLGLRDARQHGSERLCLRAIPSEKATDVSGLSERALIATVGLCHVYDATGRSDEAANVLVRASRRAGETEDFRLEFQLAIERANRAFRLGNAAEGLREWKRLLLHLPEAESCFPATAWQIWDAFHVAEARMLVESGHGLAALDKLRSLEAKATEDGRTLSALQVARLAAQLTGLPGCGAPQHPELGRLSDALLDIVPANASAARAARGGVRAAEGSRGLLTQREDEILELMRSGLSNGEIARDLNININTVKTHTKSIFSKLDVKSRTQAVVKTMR